jgi:TetR/AcrR family transcriptional regulator, tetracycline repressor protein
MARPVRPNLSLPTILDAAAVVLEREGHGGLTMRAVAAQLGVQAPAIYWYVKDKQTLELALYDHLMEGLAFAPKGIDWRADLRQMGIDLRERLLARRDVARLIPAGFFFAPKSMRQMDVALGVLIKAGLSPRNAFYAFAAGFTYVTNWCLAEGEMRTRPMAQRPGLDEAAKARITAGDYPNLAMAAASFGPVGDVDEQFLFGLDALIAGFERLAV